VNFVDPFDDFIEAFFNQNTCHFEVEIEERSQEEKQYQEVET